LFRKFLIIIVWRDLVRNKLRSQAIPPLCPAVTQNLRRFFAVDKFMVISGEPNYVKLPLASLWKAVLQQASRIGRVKQQPTTTSQMSTYSSNNKNKIRLCIKFFKCGSSSHKIQEKIFKIKKKKEVFIIIVDNLFKNIFEKDF
jgi:hypothetical protein